MTLPNQDPSPPGKSKNSFWIDWSAWLLFGLLLVLAMWRPLAVPDEGRYGEIGRWMWQSGDWLIPRLNGIPFFHKPPLLYWLEGLSVSVWGAHIGSLRLIPVLHAGLMMAVSYQVLRRWAGASLAWQACIILGSSLGFLIGGQYINHDMLVACWISIAIWCLAWSLEQSLVQHKKPSSGWALAGAAACALAVLSKGLIGILLPGWVIFLWLLLVRQKQLWRACLALPWASGMALILLIAAPWFVLAEAKLPGMLNYLFGIQQFSRYTGAGFNNVQPWWFYLIGALLLLGIWSLSLLALLVHQFRRSKALVQFQSANDCGQPQACGQRLLQLAWCWVIGILLFFSIPSSKIIGYSLPVLPALSLLAALGWTLSRQSFKPKSNHWNSGWIAMVTLAMLTAFTAQWAATDYTERRGASDLASALNCHAQPGDVLWLNNDFPYDLPFLRNAQTPMQVAQDWPGVLSSAGDNWMRELAEGAAFDQAAAAKILRTPAELQQASHLNNQWLVISNRAGLLNDVINDGWQPVFKGRTWMLLQSASPDKSPVTAQEKGLNRCQPHGNHQAEQIRP